MSRKAKEADVIELPPPVHGNEPLFGLGVAKTPNSTNKWFAYKCCTTGHVDVLTPLYGGQLRGESKQAAAARLKNAIMEAMGRPESFR